MTYPQYILDYCRLASQYGFLPDETPLRRLPEYYLPWELIIEALPVLVRTRRIRSKVDELPILSTAGLSSENECRRAYSILSFITHAYIWSGDSPSEFLPAQICKPYLEIAEHFGLASTATYAALNLWNWAPQTPESNLASPEDVHMLHSFTGTVDEKWFYAISVAIEARGAMIVSRMLDCFQAINSDCAATTAHLLWQISDQIMDLGEVLDRMHERCDPHVFYHHIRPFLAGSKGMENAGLPDGVFYDEGAGRGSWRQYSGGSNAQSSLIQLLDIMLGIEHFATGCKTLVSSIATAQTKQGYIEEMRRYMPQQHKDFLQHVATITNIRPYATRSDANAAVKAAYTSAIESLTMFRNKHINIVTRYIIAPSRQSRMHLGHAGVNIATASTAQSDERTEGESLLSGTGGTHLIPFLKQTRDETKDARLDSEITT